MKFTEQQIEKMASPISETEEEKCKNAIRMVRDAMKELDYTDDGKEITSYVANTHSFSLDLRQRDSNRKIKLLVQGSYANKTNISSKSDVDIAVILEPTFKPKYRKGITSEAYGFTARTFSAAAELKDEVEQALNEHFGYKGVERHDKSIKVIGNTYRVGADVVPAYRYPDYSNDWDNNPKNYIGGIEIRPDNGGRIINFPEQHIKSGIEKNKETNYKFKKCVRIAKNMREEMKYGFRLSDKISSFGIESLLWNVDTSAYTKYPSILDTFDEVLLFLMDNFYDFDGYKEANAIKPLFPNQSNKWAYQEFVEEMYQFFEHD